MLGTCVNYLATVKQVVLIAFFLFVSIFSSQICSCACLYESMRGHSLNINLSLHISCKIQIPYDFPDFMTLRSSCCGQNP